MGDTSKILTEDDEEEAFGLMGEGRAALRKGDHQGTKDHKNILS